MLIVLCVIRRPGQEISLTPRTWHRLIVKAVMLNLAGNSMQEYMARPLSWVIVMPRIVRNVMADMIFSIMQIRDPALINQTFPYYVANVIKKERRFQEAIMFPNIILLKIILREFMERVYLIRDLL
jgi:hypothetical protein